MSVPYPYDGSQLCAQIDPETFFPDGRLRNKEALAEAKSLCKRCPILNACKEYSQATPGLYGVWAGKWRDGTGYSTPASVTDSIRKRMAS